jgi:shikimate kinase
MGSGKSTVGRHLASKIGSHLIELDHRIEQETRTCIGDIFSNSGEEGFRKIETSVLRGLTDIQNTIISTGGGTPIFHDNMDWMKTNGTVIHLQCRPGVLFHRLAPEKSKRPLLVSLTDIDLMGFIIDLLKQRLPYYSRAHIQINAENTPEDVVIDILRALKHPTTNF